MGYCAKVRIYSHIHIYCVIVLFVSNQVNEMHGASTGSSWPSMKTYDIWGSSQNQAKPLHTQRGTLTASNDLQLQDYRYKTSFRNEKGMERHETVLILYAFYTDGDAYFNIFFFLFFLFKIVYRFDVCDSI